MGARYAFDLETNGLLDTVSKVHSLVLRDIETDERFSYIPDNIEKGLARLADADEIIGQNIIAFDLPVLQKVHRWSIHDNTSMIVTDTMVLSRLAYPDIGEDDALLIRKKKMPGNMYGRHSLEAWGHRLGEHKGDYSTWFKAKHGKDADPWAVWSPEMQTYCEQDVEVTVQLHKRLMAQELSAIAIAIEHAIQWIVSAIERNGFPFDSARAAKLWALLVGRQEELTTRLRELFPPWFAPDQHKGSALIVPKVNNKTRGIEKGVEYSKIKLCTFNPQSRDHIADRLAKKYAWKPTKFTDGGKPQIDETVLAALPYPEAKELAELFLLQKRVGQIAGGDEAWLKKVQPDGRIHGRYNANGAVTGRASHFSPNIAQVPKVGKPYGKECRELFTASPGYVVLGADLQGLELRCLGHYMSRWDKGEYARVVVSGDPHTINMRAAGIDKQYADPKVARDKSKTFIYQFLYGAGDHLLAVTVYSNKKLSAAELKRLGAKLRKQFLAGLPALGKLVERVQKSAKTRGYLIGLDGRKLKVRSQHAALNTLLQSCGAILCKAWIVEIEKQLHLAGYKHGVGEDYAILAWVHDELQIEVRAGLENAIGEIIKKAALTAGETYGFVPPLEAEWKSGRNWAETH